MGQGLHRFLGEDEKEHRGVSAPQYAVPLLQHNEIGIDSGLQRPSDIRIAYEGYKGRTKGRGQKELPYH